MLSDPLDISRSQRVFLSTVAPAKADWILASTIAIISMIVFVCLAPFAKVQLPIVPAFIPTYESALLICDLITATLLFGQFSLLRSRALLVLAGAYLFSGLMAIPHALTFPGVFSPTGLLGAGTHTTSWIYISWHVIFPLIVIAYASIKNKQQLISEAISSREAIAWTVVAAAGTTLTLSLITILGQDYLPPILNQSLHYAPHAVVSLWFAYVATIAGLVLLIARRPHTLIDVWLIVVMFAWAFDVGLSAAFNNGRYDIGFYAGRIFVLLGGSVVLTIMLVELTRLYSRLTIYAGSLEAGVRAEMDERKRAEATLAQVQKMEAIGNLTGGMAHDFNNMLGVVIGNLDTALLTAEGEVAELIKDSIDACTSASELTRRLLAFARKQPLRPERLDTGKLIINLVELLRRTIGEDINISLDLGKDVWPIVADKAQLESSLTNLVTNARDAMPHGGRLYITTNNRHLDADYAAMYPEVIPGDYSVIEVTDTGTGMSTETLAHIFEPFFTTKDVGKGTGLGLSMVFGFIKQSKGHVSVYSELGVGSTFRLYFPRVRDEEDDTAAFQEIARTAIRGNGETILVVEDNDRLRRVVLRQIQGLGYKTIESNGPDHAIELLRKTDQHIDLLFTDIVMPGSTDGIGVAQAALTLQPHIKVLMTSGFPGGVNLHDRLGTGDEAVHLLSKPYRLDELSVSLHEAIKG